MRGHITNAIIQHSDITDRVRAEEALRDSEARFREVLEIRWTRRTNATCRPMPMII